MASNYTLVSKIMVKINFDLGFERSSGLSVFERVFFNMILISRQVGRIASAGSDGEFEPNRPFKEKNFVQQFVYRNDYPDAGRVRSAYANCDPDNLISTVVCGGGTFRNTVKDYRLINTSFCPVTP